MPGTAHGDPHDRPDKVNQLRHACFLRSPQAFDLMARHREILRPKFDTVLRIPSERLGLHASPPGPSPGRVLRRLDVVDGTARASSSWPSRPGSPHPAGASFPYGGTATSASRLFPPLDELTRAMEGLSTCAPSPPPRSSTADAHVVA